MQLLLAREVDEKGAKPAPASKIRVGGGGQEVPLDAPGEVVLKREVADVLIDGGFAAVAQHALKTFGE